MDTNFITNTLYLRYGYYEDTRNRLVETQLFYCNSRYYSPELCRWISPDSIKYLDPESINGLNLYAYCNNDPVIKYDPTGHIAISISAIIIGAVIGFASVYVSDVVENVKKDGFQVNDLLTINKDNLVEYIANTVGGALTGLVGGLGINTIISAPLVGAIDTLAAYFSGDISSWGDAALHFGISTFVSSLTLGTQRISAKYKNPQISRGNPTTFNRFLEKSAYLLEKGIYHYGQHVDDAVAATMIIFGVY